jgi:hypothetical protein
MFTTCLYVEEWLMEKDFPLSTDSGKKTSESAEKYVYL